MIDTGNTAWLLTATALVLFMTLPGLALFYGGLVRAADYIGQLGDPHYLHGVGDVARLRL